MSGPWLTSVNRAAGTGVGGASPPPAEVLRFSVRVEVVVGALVVTGNIVEETQTSDGNSGSFTGSFGSQVAPVLI